MGKFVWFLIVLLMVGLCLPTQGMAQQNVKLGQTGMQFLSVVSDARAAAMASSATTLRMESASLFFNPAGMAESDATLNFSASYNQWIADIKHLTASLSYRPGAGDLGVFGISLQFVNYGDILGTNVSLNNIGYVDTGLLNAYAIAMGVGYARALSESFSVGGQVKFVMQKLGESEVPTADGIQIKKNSASVAAFDFGTIFKPGFKSFAFGMSVRNFSKQIAFQEETFELPLTFSIGVSMDIMDLLKNREIINSAYLSIDAVHNRDYYEQIKVGGDISLLDVLDLRAGYITSTDEQGVTLGFGVHRFGMAVDYAYAPFGVFTNAQRFTVRYTL